MADLVKIYQDMIFSLEIKSDAAASLATREAIKGLIEGARQNLAAAQKEPN